VDNTSAIGTGLSKQFSFLKIAQTEQNLDYGGGRLLGLSVSKDDYLAWINSDLQNRPR
jgi:hypothetical protein